MEEDKLERLVSQCDFVGEEIRFWTKKLQTINNKRKERHLKKL